MISKLKPLAPALAVAVVGLLLFGISFAIPSHTTPAKPAPTVTTTVTQTITTTPSPAPTPSRTASASPIPESATIRPSSTPASRSSSRHYLPTKVAPKPKYTRPKATRKSGSYTSAKAYARSVLSSTQYSCLNSLFMRESGWQVNATNPSSGAYGIPQALPGSKMASAGPDWRTNGVTQVKWGLSYIRARYSTPCGAWAHSQRTGWY